MVVVLPPMEVVVLVLRFSIMLSGTWTLGIDIPLKFSLFYVPWIPAPYLMITSHYVPCIWAWLPLEARGLGELMWLL